MSIYKNRARDINYVGRDFTSLKTNLVEFAKSYFPNTVKDFSEASPSTMYIEMAAYVGDVLSYYTDYSLRESMLHRAQEKQNVYALAQAFGYKPTISAPATTNLTVYSLIPGTGTGVDIQPDWDYAPRIARGMECQTGDGVKFKTTREVNFNYSSSVDPTTLNIYSTDASTGAAEWYILSKTVPAISGEEKIQTITVGPATEYPTYTIADTDVQSIESITDSDNNEWLEVPYLAQSTVFDETVNSVANDPSLSEDSVNVPYILKLKKTNRRFVTRIKPDNKIELRFGSGVSTNDDETLIPNPENVGANISGRASQLDTAFDPANFLYTDTYGQAPSNTTLTVKYNKGYGLRANVNTKSITVINSKTVTFNTAANLVKGTRQAVIDNLTITNNEPATGARGPENVETVRQNSLAFFGTQNRIVTKEDYVVRALSLPAKFGSVAKAYVARDEQMRQDETLESNPLAVNLYVLAYDKNNNLTTLSRGAKENLRTYLSQYRMMTDAINIKNGYIINIGIEFSITILPNNNSNAVLSKCIQALKNKYHIDNFTFKTPIQKKDLYICLADIPGVQSVIDCTVTNKWGDDYSINRYNIEEGTYNDTIYPSLDPSVFEIKYPNDDIKGKVVSY